MNSRRLARFLWAALVVFPTSAWAQAESRPPREFPAFRGTWVLDESAGRGHIAGLPVARTLTITTTPTDISLVKDSANAEVYRLDGTETKLGDGRSTSFALVAESLALTTRRYREDRGYGFTNVITDASSVSGDVLTIERQLSVVVQPLVLEDGRARPGPGRLATLETPDNNRQTFVYRRNTQVPGR